MDAHADHPPPPRGPHRGPWVFLVLLISLLLYAPSVGNDFTWDDRWAAMGHNGEVRNPLVAELRPIGDYFSSHYWPGKTEVSHTYRPVTVLTFAVRHALLGDDARAAHLVNVLLHVLAVWLSYLMLVRLGVAWQAACLGALVFGVHAIHSEAVANVVGRAEMLGFCGGAGALLLLAGSRRFRAPVMLARGLGAALLLFLAFHSKESALAWVAFIPLFLWVDRMRRGGDASGAVRGGLGLVAAVAVPAVVYLSMRARVLASLPGDVDPSIGYLENPLLDAPLFERLCSGTLAWGNGLLLTVFPFDLAVDYGPDVLPVVSAWSQPWFFGAAAVGALLVGMAVAGVLGARRQPLLFLAMAMFLGFSFVVTNIPFPVFMMFAERTYYMPSFGLTLAVAWFADRVLRAPPASPRTRMALPAILGLWLVASATVTVQRSLVWRNDEVLVLSEVETNPRSVRMQLCAGDLWRGRGMHDVAEVHFRRAADLDPRSPYAWLELGHVLLDQGKRAAAERALAKAREARRPERLQERVEQQIALDRLATRLAPGSPR